MLLLAPLAVLLFSFKLFTTGIELLQTYEGGLNGFLTYLFSTITILLDNGY